MGDTEHQLMYMSLQKRVRHLHSVYVRNMTCPAADVSCLQTYFSLHRTRSTPAFYKSETVLASLNPSWESFDLNCIDPTCTTSNCVTIRLWCAPSQGAAFVVHVRWDVDLRGLVYLGDKVRGNKVDDRSTCAPDTLVFGLWSGCFGAPPQHPTVNPSLLNDLRPVASGRLPADPNAEMTSPHRRDFELNTSKFSYSASLLTRLQTVLRALKQTRASVERVRKEIHAKLQTMGNRTKKSEAVEIMELRCRRLQQAVASERQLVLEKRKALVALSLANEAAAKETSQCKARIQSEAKQVEDLRVAVVENRGKLNGLSLLVRTRTKELAMDMAYMYPIQQVSADKFSIAGVVLPNAEDFQGHTEVSVSVGLGCVAHLVSMLSRYLDIPLQFPIECRGSRSIIIDAVLDRPAPKDGEFPLFGKGKDKVSFRYAVFLLNKNVAQLRHSLGMPTSDLRMTLPHMHSFLQSKFGVSSPVTTPMSLPQPIPTLMSTVAVQRTPSVAAFSVPAASTNGPTFSADLVFSGSLSAAPSVAATATATAVAASLDMNNIAPKTALPISVETGLPTATIVGTSDAGSSDSSPTVLAVRTRSSDNAKSSGSDCRRHAVLLLENGEGGRGGWPESQPT